LLEKEGNGLSKNSCRRSKFLANTVNMCHRGTTVSFLYPSHVDNAFHRYFHDGYFRGFPVEDVVHWFGAYSRQNCRKYFLPFQFVDCRLCVSS